MHGLHQESALPIFSRGVFHLVPPDFVSPRVNVGLAVAVAVSVRNSRSMAKKGEGFVECRQGEA